MSDEHERAAEDEVLRQLLASGSLEGVAAGVTRQVLARGEETLSERQEWVFNSQVRARYLTRACYLCEQLIPLSEVAGSWDNGGLCATCAAIMGKS